MLSIRGWILLMITCSSHSFVISAGSSSRRSSGGRRRPRTCFRGIIQLPNTFRRRQKVLDETFPLHSLGFSDSRQATSSNPIRLGNRRSHVPRREADVMPVPHVADRLQHALGVGDLCHAGAAEEVRRNRVQWHESKRIRRSSALFGKI